jgi:hypothetical protein
MSDKRLWEAKHPYAACEGNYFSSECHSHHETWAEFLEEEGNSDLDMNLVYRWDWRVADEVEPGDVLELYFIGQRKAVARSVYVNVKKSDEPAVRAWLQPRLQRLLELWAPMVMS